jgi:acyl-coenzyme A thioesterase PaaI-like protein
MDNEDLLPVVPFPGAGERRTFVSGEPDTGRLRVSYFRRGQDGPLVARVFFGPGSTGPPGYAHGGAVAAVLDEAMGAGVWLAGYAAVARRIIVDFRDMVPVGFEGLVETRIEGTEGRKISIRAWLFDGEHVLAEAEGLFVTLSEDQMQAMGKI